MIEMLIENGAPVNIIGNSNYSPIHLAARAGQCMFQTFKLRYLYIKTVNMSFCILANYGVRLECYPLLS